MQEFGKKYDIYLLTKYCTEPFYTSKVSSYPRFTFAEIPWPWLYLPTFISENVESCSQKPHCVRELLSQRQQQSKLETFCIYVERLPIRLLAAFNVFLLADPKETSLISSSQGEVWRKRGANFRLISNPFWNLKADRISLNTPLMIWSLFRLASITAARWSRGMILA